MGAHISGCCLELQLLCGHSLPLLAPEVIEQQRACLPGRRHALVACLPGRLHALVAVLAGMAAAPALLCCMQGRLLASLEGHSKRVTGVAYVTPEVLVSSSADKTVRVWRGPVQGPGEFTCTHTLKDHTGEVSLQQGSIAAVQTPCVCCCAVRPWPHAGRFACVAWPPSCTAVAHLL